MGRNTETRDALLAEIERGASPSEAARQVAGISGWNKRAAAHIAAPQPVDPRVYQPGPVGERHPHPQAASRVLRRIGR